MYKVNINDIVKVKLTEHGIKVLKEQYKEFYETFGVGLPDYEPNIDEHGYTSFQMHDLIERLGPCLGMCKPLPFETEIIITKAQSMDC
ncbi:hypothetical protein [Paenibacillus macerans]|uniref:hypothetical protein n=1 Tax=Paenibacillus macerans TaxID=44252 RepID=UPI00203CC2EA|nr:hypothetical protein [Paenibacillus macerans]MCM3701446.1 hypothetical protein [Paenibacillus macerans]